MRFNQGRDKNNDPEINLIPFIDVLLVIIIFLMLTTTYSRFSGLDVSLPSADGAKQEHIPEEINIVITLSGQILVNRTPLSSTEVADISHSLKNAAAGGNPSVVISADANATYQRIIDVMQAAQQAGLTKISFATQPRTMPTQ